MHTKITVKYFAMLREKVGKDAEDLIINPGETVLALYSRLATRYDFPLKAEELRFAINDQFVSNNNQELVKGDVVVFIPPVSGG